MDGSSHLVAVCAGQVLNLERQPALVQQLQRLPGPADRADAVMAGEVDLGYGRVFHRPSLAGGMRSRACRHLRRQSVSRRGTPRGSRPAPRSEEHTSELQSLMRISYAVFCLKKKKLTHKFLESDSHIYYNTTPQHHNHTYHTSFTKQNH